MTQLIELMPKDTRSWVPDQITLHMRCLQDAEVRRDANRDHHNRLEDAFKAVQKAIAKRQHNKMLRSTRTRADQNKNKRTTKGTRFPPKHSN
jgi:hypothetical protein